MKQKHGPSLDAAVTDLRGVGPRVAQKLERLGIYHVRDLLFHMPIRYLDRTRLSPIGALRTGKSAQVEGVIEITQVKYGKRRSLLCRISDGTGAITLRFFYFSRAQQQRLHKGVRLRCYGQPRLVARTLEMIHPEYQLLAPEEVRPVDENLTPVYPATEGLQQSTLRRLAEQALAALENPDSELTELLPQDLLNTFALPDLQSAIRLVHKPPPDTETAPLMEGIHPAQQRLAFEELLAQYLALRRLRQKLRVHAASPVTGTGKYRQRLLNALSFKLTGAQERALCEIQEDLGKSHPMLRLLQGDVGSGKTVVATLAALQAVESGYQTALMVPTELLAEQHYQTLQKWLADLDICVLLVTGRLTRTERSERLQVLNDNRPCIVVGTHALFQQDVNFSSLRLIIIDEQHRFGVHQRLALLDKGKQESVFPHQLIMTATPIPRTLAMTMYADLDISVIDELPPGRQEINTVVLSTEKRDEVIERISVACAEGRQVYWVCTLIEESEALQCETAVDTHRHLQQNLPGINIGLIHGRLKSQEKDNIMNDFKSGRIQLLVATTVIEVGVDVPRASLMIIENAERLGLFQLHQLRGRIGRGSLKSDCVLLYQPPLSETARIRLDTMRQTNDGFKIAQKDLELRGPGDLLGARQTGLPELRIADLIRDAALLPTVHRAADIMLREYPDRIPALVNRWLGRNTDLAKV